MQELLDLTFFHIHRACSLIGPPLIQTTLACLLGHDHAMILLKVLLLVAALENFLRYLVIQQTIPTYISKL